MDVIKPLRKRRGQRKTLDAFPEFHLQASKQKRNRQSDLQACRSV